MRVLMVGTAAAAGGGMQSVVRAYCAEWDHAAYPLRYVGLSTVGSVPVRLLWILRGLLIYAFWLIVWRPDVVHLHVSHRGSVWRKGICLLLAKAVRRRVIWHMHNGRFDAFYANNPPPLQVVIRFLMCRADLVVTLSPRWQRFVHDLVPGQTVVILANPVALRPSAAPEQSPVIVALGTLRPEKGTADLIAAARQVARTHPDARFVLAGSGDLAYWHQQAHDLPQVTLPGWIDAPARDDLLNRASLLVHPSRHEGMPLAVLEAMAAGLPVIASAVGGLPDLLRDGETGCLLPPGNPDALAAAIRHLLDHPDFAQTLGAAARQHVAAHYSVPHVLDQLYRLYNGLTFSNTN